MWKKGVKVLLASTLVLSSFELFGVKDAPSASVAWIHQLFSIKYAPKEWKRTLFDWDLDVATQKLSDDLTYLSTEEALNTFFHSMKDHHVAVTFYGEGRAILPLLMKRIDGNFWIVEVNAEKLPDSMQWIKPGLEVIDWEGEPIGVVVSRLEKHLGMFEPDRTAQAFVDLMLTQRFQKQGVPLPQEMALNLTLKMPSGEIKSVDVPWEFSSQVPSMPLKSMTMSLERESNMSDLVDDFLDKKMCVDFDMDQECLDAFNHLPGNKRGVLPPVGEIIWETPTDNPFYAYLFTGPDQKTYGFIRIPTYQGDGKALKERSQAFGALMALFEEKAEAVVIDQTHNSGGSVLYMFSILSRLTDRTLVTPQQQESISQREAALAKSTKKKLKTDPNAIRTSFRGYEVSPLTEMEISHYCDFIIQQVADGQTLSDFYPMMGMTVIEPHPQEHCTKPLLILIDEWDLSCADLFPAILQDNLPERVKLLGLKTAGAGGTVEEQSFPNPWKISNIRLTTSFVKRPSGEPIENYGVFPDIEYELTPDDIQQNYRPYIQKILHTLPSLTS